VDALAPSRDAASVRAAKIAEGVEKAKMRQEIKAAANPPPAEEPAHITAAKAAETAEIAKMKAEQASIKSGAEPLIQTPEQFAAHKQLQSIAQKLASERGMQYAGGVRTAGPNKAVNRLFPEKKP
jgi:hypothetical protein